MAHDDDGTTSNEPLLGNTPHFVGGSDQAALQLVFGHMEGLAVHHEVTTTLLFVCLPVLTETRSSAQSNFQEWIR